MGNLANRFKDASDVDNSGERLPSRRRDPIAKRAEGRDESQGDKRGPDDGRVRRGRPRLEQKGETLTAKKPWLTQVPPMSRSTWYRRRKEEK